MTEDELREKCKLGPTELISTNIGDLDILHVQDDTVTLGVLATGAIFKESCESVINKLRSYND